MSGSIWMTIIIGSVVLIAISNWWLGFWSNLISLVNVLLAGLIATSFYQNVSNEMLRLDESWILVVDFVSVWLLFALCYILLRGLTEQLSRIRLRFHPILDYIGSAITTLATGFLFVSFLCFTMMFAPIPVEDATAFNEKGIYPEQMWCQLAVTLSNNSMAAQPTSAWFGDVEAAGAACRPSGDAAWYVTYGDFIREKIAGTTNLRIAKPKY